METGFPTKTFGNDALKGTSSPRIFGGDPKRTTIETQMDGETSPTRDYSNLNASIGLSIAALRAG